ncbi:MAG TPA: sugar transferase [Acidobacteriaceae bacterium]|jgi:exopolysaccharide biosynthesis polyprenyl glycosylphosphotransferase|nr:sugar transferase [Acidobacteriaceae bacterium]
MASPDYIQQVVVPGNAQTGADGGAGSFFGRLFRRRSVEGLAWAFTDILLIAIAAYVSLAIRDNVALHGAHWYSLPREWAPGSLETFLDFAWFAFSWVILARSYGLYLPIQHMGGLHEQRRVVQATLTAGLLLCGVLYISRSEDLSRVAVFMAMIFGYVLVATRRAVWRKVIYARYKEGVATRNIVIVGSGRVGRALRSHLESLRHLGFRFKGYIAMDANEAEKGGANVVGTLDNCVPLARSLFVDEIFLSVPCERKRVLELVEEARTVGIDVRVVPDLYDGLAWNAPVEYVGQFPTIPLHRREMPAGAFIGKRVLDLVLSAIVLVFVSPVMLLIALLIRIDSPGQPMYYSNRIGRKGRTFKLYKFRTMVKGADAQQAELEHMNERDGVLFKITNDPRITRIGRTLRKYSLDELPQFYNVLLGDMSIVGPRPPLANEVEQYDLTHLRRLDVLPGITGLWQVEARQDPSFDSYISLDTAYVENWTLWLDLKILARTVSVVLGGTGS